MFMKLLWYCYVCFSILYSFLKDMSRRSKYLCKLNISSTKFVRPLVTTSQLPVRPLAVGMATAYHTQNEDIQRFYTEKVNFGD